MNIQHLESLNDQIREITGMQVRETIPDWVVKQADEVVLIDLPPRALLNRLQRGVIYGKEKAERALDNFFKESDARRAARNGACARPRMKWISGRGKKTRPARRGSSTRSGGSTSGF